MLLTVTPFENPGPPSPAPPPTAPKPQKDNARLQRLLKKAAKRSSVQPSPTQPHKSFRSTLSPVSEADLESLEPTAPQKQQPISINLPPRFQVRGTSQRVSSPYPKQRSFTFTVVEQHSLNQYLSPSPVPETSSPRPLGSSSHSPLFLYPPGSSTPDLASQEINVIDTPLPCTPQTKPISPKQPAVPHLAITDPPVIVVHDTNQKTTGLIPPNTDKVEKRQSDPNVLKTESDPCTAKAGDVSLSKAYGCLISVPKTQQSPLVAQQETLYKSSACSPLGVENKSAQVPATSPSPVVSDKKGNLLECSRVAEIPSSTSLPLGSTKTIIEAKNTDSPNVFSEVTPKNLPVKGTSSPNIAGSNHVISVTDSSTTLGKVPNSEELNLLKTAERPRPPRKKPGGGWARLVKHLVVEPEEPTFNEQQKAEGKDEKTGSDVGATTEGTQQSKGIRANRMWDAILYHMATSTKGQEKPGTAPPPLPFIRSRLPLLLHRPRFDARKLKEAASRPLRRVTAFFHRRITEKAPSSFNRSASGWSIRGEDGEQEKGVGGEIIDGEVKA
ncbi:proline-rich protein 33 [Pseudophryne corroboree]|uniref:proline-rich protein 33 n=1 Tax=Pseudophryne corroboree TaxID=495146 RepID=UPI00308156F8